MATVGEIKGRSNAKREICLLAAAVANNSIPTLSTDGVPCYPDNRNFNADQGHCYTGQAAKMSTLMIKGDCTAGQVLVGTFTLWGYLQSADAWFEIPVGGGTIITPTALAENDTDKIRYAQQISYLGHYDRLFLQLAAIGGAGATYDAWLVTAQESF